MMAKDSNKGQARVRIFYADVEAGDDATERVLQSVAQAFARALQPQQPRPVVRALPPATSTNGKTAAPQGELFTADEEPDIIEPDTDEELDAASQPDRANGKAKTRKPPTYSIVKDLNLKPEGKPWLRAFFTEKAPADQQEQVTVMLYYLANVLDLKNIGVNHIFTCFKEVEKRSPVEIAQLARKVANRKGWIDSSDSNNLRMTTPGQNYVEHDLPGTKPTNA